MAVPRKKKGILGERMMQIILAVNQVIAKTGSISDVEDAADVIYCNKATSSTKDLGVPHWVL